MGAWDDEEGVAGNGGWASLYSAGPVSVDSGNISVAGGNAGSYYGEGYGFGYGEAGVTEGSGGSVWVSLGGLTLTSNAYYQN